MYLGQWLNEVASFNIEQESGRVVGITTWRLFDRDRTLVGASGDPWVDPFSHRFRTDQLYTGLKIETGSGKVFEIPPDDPEKLGYEKVHFRENAFEEFVSHDSKEHVPQTHWLTDATGGSVLEIYLPQRLLHPALQAEAPISFRPPQSRSDRADLLAGGARLADRDML